MNSRWYHQKPPPPPQERCPRNDRSMMTEHSSIVMMMRMMMRMRNDSILPTNIMTMNHTILRAVVTNRNEQAIRMAQITYTSTTTTTASHDPSIDTGNSLSHSHSHSNSSHHRNHPNLICLDEAYQILQKTLDYYNSGGDAGDDGHCSSTNAVPSPAHPPTHHSRWSDAHHHGHQHHHHHGHRDDCHRSSKIITPPPPLSSTTSPIPEAELLRFLPPLPLTPVPRTVPLTAHLQAYPAIYDKLPIAIYHHMFTIPQLPSTTMSSPWDFLLRTNDHWLTTAILWYNMALLLHLQCLTLAPSTVSTTTTTMSRSKLLHQALHSYHQAYYAILMVQPSFSLERVTLPLLHQHQQLQQMQYSTLLKSAVCHNLAILNQSEYSNMYMALLLRCQLVQTLQEHHQQQQDLHYYSRRVRAGPPATLVTTMPPHPDRSVVMNPATLYSTTTLGGMEVSEYVFFHLGIFFAMINEFQLAPAA